MVPVAVSCKRMETYPQATLRPEGLLDGFERL